jgi:hypothetical protein
MTKHFIRELEKTKKMILTLGAMAEERVHLAIKAIRKKDATIARKIINPTMNWMKWKWILKRNASKYSRSINRLP